MSSAIGNRTTRPHPPRPWQEHKSSRPGYRESLQSFVRDQTNRKAHRGALPPKAQRGARRSITPETRAIETSDALTSEVVPQNTVAIVKPGDRSVRKLVTLQVYDCVVLTY